MSGFTGSRYTPITHPVSAAKLPGTKTLKLSLGAIGLAYAALGSCGLAYAVKGGNEWDGDSGTLTTVLAVLGVVFAVMSRFMLDQCQRASLQRLGHKSLESAVPMASLHKHDIAARGDLLEALFRSSWRGPVYRCGFPVLVILMSAILKKVFSVDYRSTLTTVSGDDATLVDPLNVPSHIRGTASGNVIIYNITASIGSGQNPNQTSWTYLTATTADSTGLEPVDYCMPSLPHLVVGGSVGYTGYVAESVPSFVSRVQCSTDAYVVSRVLGEIDNSDNTIVIGYMDNDATTIVQVTSMAANWSCFAATIANATGNATYLSDGNGAWLVSNASMRSLSSWIFESTPYRWQGFPGVISDCLGTTRSYANWSWTESSPDSVGFPDMLVATRLSLAAVVLTNLLDQNPIPPVSGTGTAYRRIQSVKLQANWALVITIILLWMQSAAVFLHLWGIGDTRLDLSMLQLLALASPPGGGGIGAALPGFCAGLRSDLKPSAWLAVRSSQPFGYGTPYRHLNAVAAFADGNENLSLDDRVPVTGWNKVRNDGPEVLYGAQSNRRGPS